ncbi:MAG: hypothetical protein J6A21_00480 [Lentisphaeria bacterium]|nr:hypothetical protein [Lentisphaeria bacterium]
MFTKVSQCFGRDCIRLFSSWCWIRQDFVSDYEALKKGRLLSMEAPGGEILWKTRQKFVLKRTAPSGRVIVCKSYHDLRNPQHFVNRPAPTGLEALNYQEILSLGLPTAEILAVGETRFFFFPRKAFLITAFLEGTRDGREFLPGGKEAENSLWKMEYCRKNMEYIAKFHDRDFLHRGFTPFNTLWREKAKEKQTEGDLLDVFWIDVASCRQPKDKERLLPGKAEDLGHFFSFFRLPEEERRFLTGIYVQNTRALGKSFEEFFPMVEACYATELEKREN